MYASCLWVSLKGTFKGIHQTPDIVFIINLHRILCGLILFLCLVGTIIDVVVNFKKSHSSPVNKSDAFMPVRNVSIVADHNQAPHIQNSLAKSDPDSDKTNLLQSSHDVNFSASISFSNFHQEPARPSECDLDLKLIDLVLKELVLTAHRID